MDPFLHLLRFFALADDQRLTPVNALTPAEKHPTLPALAGDVLRWLLPKSDLREKLPSRYEIVLCSSVSSQPAVVVGGIRHQDSERYVELELTVDGLPSPNQQFALTHSVSNPRYGTAGEPERIAVPVLGTMRGQFTDLNAYITAIQSLYEQYAHAPVVTIRQNNRLTIRIYFSQRFQPSDLDLTSWRVGLGKTPADSYNSNAPSLSAQSLGTVLIASTDTYNVIVADDIQAGNVFGLQGRTYTAIENDTPERVMVALGIPDGRLTVAAGTAIPLTAEPGTQQFRNQNSPAIELLYDSGNGSGSDRYLVVVGADCQPGNVYQVSAPGMTTKTVIAGATDTPASVASQFNAVGGFLLVPAGQNPTALTDAGTVQSDNTNVPLIYLSGKVTAPAVNVNRYRLFVGSSVRRGNKFILGDVGVTAVTGDTPLSIARKLGFDAHPFTVDVPAGQPLVAYAKRGSRYSEPDDIAPVLISRMPSCVRPTQVIAEVKIPATTKPGRYWLGLREKGDSALIARTNGLLVQAIPNGSALVRWGGTTEMRRVFGFHYAETGFTQQLRLPIHLGVGRQKTTESQSTTMTGAVLRTDLRIKLERSLTTTMQPEAFHRALLLLLKHPRLYIDGRQFESLSEYSETDPTPIGKLYQAQTNLTETDAEQQYLWTGKSDASTMARVNQIVGAETVLLYLRQNGEYTAISEGRLFAAGEYDLLAQTPGEPLQLLVYLNDLLVLNVLLTANSLNQAGRLRIGPDDGFTLIVRPALDTIADWSNSTLVVPTPQVTVDNPETEVRPGDFGTDYSKDFIH